MKSPVAFVLIFLCAYQFFHVNSLECQYCSSTDCNSNCRKGTETTMRTCTLEGEDHCYEEYIINKGSKPLYRRGCAPGDWCQQQVVNHGTALKFCKTCQGSQCNNDIIGSNSSSLLCRSCQSRDPNGECRSGTVTTTEECSSGQVCVMSYISTTKRDEYRRGCGKQTFCVDEKSKYANSLIECSDCPYDLCNNEGLTLVFS